MKNTTTQMINVQGTVIRKEPKAVFAYVPLGIFFILNDNNITNKKQPKQWRCTND